MSTRTETDSLGPVDVPADSYWGAQTERSRANFRIGGERMPRAIVDALLLIKAAAAEANAGLGLLPADLAAAIADAARALLDPRYDEEFPLLVWQSARRIPGSRSDPIQHCEDKVP